jgi:hypothetical protein
MKKKKCSNCSCDNAKEIKPSKDTHAEALGGLEILSVKDNPDGSAMVDFECGEKFIEFYKAETGVKRVTKAGLEKFISKIILLTTEDEERSLSRKKSKNK